MKESHSPQNIDSDNRLPLLWVAVSLCLGFGLWFAQSPVAGASDVRVHIRSAQMYFFGLADNLNLPDWDASAYDGRGTPMLRYIGQLPLILASIFQLFGASPALSVKLTVILSALTGLYGLWKLLVETGTQKAFAACAVFFVAQPAATFMYGVTLIFQNICAHFISPWLWLAALRIWRGKKHALLSGALAMAAIAWTHLLYVLMTGYLWEIFMFLSWIRFRHRRFIAAMLLVPVMAIALAAPYIFPVIFNKNEVRYEITSRVFQPGKTYCEFLDEPLKDRHRQIMSFLEALAVITVIPETKTTLPSNVTSLQIMSSPQRNEAMRPWLWLTALILLLTGLAGILKFKNRPDRENHAGPEWLIPGVFGIFMTLSCSKALHYLLPGATDMQFPFRWLLPASGILTPLIAAAIVRDESFESYLLSVNRYLAGAGIFVMLSAGLMLQLFFWPLPQNSIDEFFAHPGHLQPFYPSAVPDLKKLPLNAGLPHQLALISGEAEISGYQAGITRMQCDMVASAPVELNILTHYDKYWQLTISSKNAELKASPENGTMFAAVPAGSWHLELSRRAPDGRNTGWLLMFGVLLLMFRQYKKRL